MKKKYCNICDADLAKNDIGLSKKMLGRDTKRLFCMHCLANFLDITLDELFEKIEDFKMQGCELFL